MIGYAYGLLGVAYGVYTHNYFMVGAGLGICIATNIIQEYQNEDSE